MKCHLADTLILFDKQGIKEPVPRNRPANSYNLFSPNCSILVMAELRYSLSDSSLISNSVFRITFLMLVILCA